jgi:hypothetical protein
MFGHERVDDTSILLILLKQKKKNCPSLCLIYLRIHF